MLLASEPQRPMMRPKGSPPYLRSRVGAAKRQTRHGRPSARPVWEAGYPQLRTREVTNAMVNGMADLSDHRYHSGM